MSSCLVALLPDGRRDYYPWDEPNEFEVPAISYDFDWMRYALDIKNEHYQDLTVSFRLVNLDVLPSSTR